MHISNFIKEGDFKDDVDYGEEFYDEIEVYFPVDNNYDVGVHHKLYYYSENSNIEEKYDGVVVEENNKNLM